MRCHIELVIEVPDTLKVGDSVGEGEILSDRDANDAVWYEGLLKVGKGRPQQWKIWAGWSAKDGSVKVDGELWYDDEGNRCYAVSKWGAIHEMEEIINEVAKCLYYHRTEEMAVR